MVAELANSIAKEIYTPLIAKEKFEVLIRTAEGIHELGKRGHPGAFGTANDILSKMKIEFHSKKTDNGKRIIESVNNIFNTISEQMEPTKRDRFIREMKKIKKEIKTSLRNIRKPQDAPLHIKAIEAKLNDISDDLLPNKTTLMEKLSSLARIEGQLQDEAAKEILDQQERFFAKMKDKNFYNQELNRFTNSISQDLAKGEPYKLNRTRKLANGIAEATNTLKTAERRKKTINQEVNALNKIHQDINRDKNDQGAQSKIRVFIDQLKNNLITNVNKQIDIENQATHDELLYLKKLSDSKNLVETLQILETPIESLRSTDGNKLSDESAENLKKLRETIKKMHPDDIKDFVTNRALQAKPEISRINSFKEIEGEQPHEILEKYPYFLESLASIRSLEKVKSSKQTEILTDITDLLKQNKEDLIKQDNIIRDNKQVIHFKTIEANYEELTSKDTETRKVFNDFFNGNFDSKYYSRFDSNTIAFLNQAQYTINYVNFSETIQKIITLVGPAIGQENITIPETRSLIIKMINPWFKQLPSQSDSELLVKMLDILKNSPAKTYSKTFIPTTSLSNTFTSTLQTGLRGVYNLISPEVELRSISSLQDAINKSRDSIHNMTMEVFSKTYDNLKKLSNAGFIKTPAWQERIRTMTRLSEKINGMNKKHIKIENEAKKNKRPLTDDEKAKIDKERFDSKKETMQFLWDTLYKIPVDPKNDEQELVSLISIIRNMMPGEYQQKLASGLLKTFIGETSQEQKDKLEAEIKLLDDEHFGKAKYADIYEYALFEYSPSFVKSFVTKLGNQAIENVKKNLQQMAGNAINKLTQKQQNWEQRMHILDEYSLKLNDIIAPQTRVRSDTFVTIENVKMKEIEKEPVKEKSADEVVRETHNIISRFNDTVQKSIEQIDRDIKKINADITTKTIAKDRNLKLATEKYKKEKESYDNSWNYFATAPKKPEEDENVQKFQQQIGVLENNLNNKINQLDELNNLVDKNKLIRMCSSFNTSDLEKNTNDLRMMIDKFAKTYSEQLSKINKSKLPDDTKTQLKKIINELYSPISQALNDTLVQKTMSKRMDTLQTELMDSFGATDAEKIGIYFKHLYFVKEREKELMDKHMLTAKSQDLITTTIQSIYIQLNKHVNTTIRNLSFENLIKQDPNYYQAQLIVANEMLTQLKKIEQTEPELSSKVLTSTIKQLADRIKEAQTITKENPELQSIIQKYSKSKTNLEKLFTNELNTIQFKARSSEIELLQKTIEHINKNPNMSDTNKVAALLGLLNHIDSELQSTTLSVGVNNFKKVTNTIRNDILNDLKKIEKHDPLIAQTIRKNSQAAVTNFIKQNKSEFENNELARKLLVERKGPPYEQRTPVQPVPTRVSEEPKKPKPSTFDSHRGQ